MEIVSIYILIELSLVSTHFLIPCEGHLKQVLHIFGYLNIHNKMSLMFDFNYTIIRHNLFNYITGLVYTWIQSILFLLILLKQGYTKFLFLFLVMTTLQGKIPTDADRRGSWCLWISIPSNGISRSGQAFNQLLLEQRPVPLVRVKNRLIPYIVNYEYLEFQ